MRRSLQIILSLLALTLLLPLPSTANLLQRDLLTNLVTSLGWDFGLPDRPGDEDYLRIVNGNRQFHYEAENLILPTDMVALKRLRNFGQFSGQHWVSGIANRTTAHLQFLVPIGGRYQLWAGLLQPGHQFDLGGEVFQANGEARFTRVLVGEVELFPGMQELRLELPPGGGIDYIELLAPSYPPVGPIAGWQPDQPLEWSAMAATALRLLQLEQQLPLAGSPLVIEAETASQIGNASRSSAVHLGRPSAGRWLRVGADSTRVIIELKPPRSGIYRLAIRGLATAPLRLTLDEHYSFSADLGATLGLTPIGTLRLEGEGHQLAIDLPPRAGLDSLELTPLKSTAEDYLNLAGYSRMGARPTGRDLDELFALLRLLAPPR